MYRQHLAHSFREFLVSLKPGEEQLLLLYGTDFTQGLVSLLYCDLIFVSLI